MFALSALAARSRRSSTSTAAPPAAARRAGRALRRSSTTGSSTSSLISAVLSRPPGRPFFASRAGEPQADDGAVRAHDLGGADARSCSGSAIPRLSIALVGPLLAIALYQRSTFKAHAAMRLALTDPLTGLGNHRSFHERLQRELVARRAATARRSRSASSTSTTSRAINDRYGHPIGDRRARPGRLPPAPGRRGVPARRRRVRRAPAAARRAAGDRASRARSSSASPRCEIEGVGPVTVSAGVATYPTQGAGRDELIRLADSALYWAKEDGKNRVRAYAAESILRANLEQLADSPDRAAPLPRGGEPREGGRRARRVHRQPLAARRRLRGADRAASRRRRAGDRADAARGQPPRPRQARDPRGGPAQAGRPRATASGSSSSAIPDRLPDAREPRRRAGRRVGAPPPRALGRGGLSEPARRRADPARRADHLRRRRVRRDDVRHKRGYVRTAKSPPEALAELIAARARSSTRRSSRPSSKSSACASRRSTPSSLARLRRISGCAAAGTLIAAMQRPQSPR